MVLQRMDTYSIKKNLDTWNIQIMSDQAQKDFVKKLPGYFPRIADEYYWGGIQSRLLPAGDIYLCDNEMSYTALSLFAMRRRGGAILRGAHFSGFSMCIYSYIVTKSEYSSMAKKRLQ